MNRRTFLTSLVAAVVGLAGVAEARGRGKRGRDKRGRGKSRGPSGTFRGVITGASAKSLRIDAGTDRPKPMTFAVDGKTTVTSRGDRKVVGDLKPGQVVAVRAKLGKAESIDVAGTR